MQLVTDLEPYILWNNIVPINPLKEFTTVFNRFTTQIYPDIRRNLQDGYKYFHTIKARILQDLNLYNDYELISISEQDLPNFIQLYSLLVFNNPNYKLFTPSNVYAPFQGIYRAALKSQKFTLNKKQKATSESTDNASSTELDLSPNITILPIYSYLSGIPLKESDVLKGLPTARVYDLSQIFYNIYVKGLRSLSYNSNPDIFIISSRALHIPLDTILIFFKKNKKHHKLLDYITHKDNISAFDAVVNNVSWLNTWQQEQSSLLSIVSLYEFFKKTNKEILKAALTKREQMLNNLYTEMANILGTNKKKYLLPTDKAHYNVVLKLPTYIAKKIYRDLAQNYILLDYVQKTSTIAYLILTPGLEIPNKHLQETLDLLNKVM